MRLLAVGPPAERDLDGIQAYIAADDPGAAARVIDKLYAAIRRLCQRPNIGRPRPDLADGDYLFLVLFLVVRPYLVVYSHDDDFLTVIRVLHSRQDVRSILADG